MANKLLMIVNCQFTLETSRGLFQDWLVQYIQRIPWGGWFDNWAYIAGREATETQSENAIEFTYPGVLVTDSSPYQFFLCIDEATQQQRQYNPPLFAPSLNIRITDITPNRILVEATCTGGMYNDQFREFLSSIDIYWPSIQSFPCRLTYSPWDAFEIESSTSTIAEFISGKVNSSESQTEQSTMTGKGVPSDSLNADPEAESVMVGDRGDTNHLSTSHLLHSRRKEKPWERFPAGSWRRSAVERWWHGEEVNDIAKDLGYSHKTIRNFFASYRKNKPDGARIIPTMKELQEMGLRRF